MVAIGAVGNKVIRGGQGWSLSDCYLGREIALAAIAAEVLHILSLAKSLESAKAQAVGPMVNGLIFTAVYGVISFLVFLIILGFHQGLLPSSSHSGRMRVLIGVGTTLLAVILFFGFVLLVGRT